MDADHSFYVKAIETHACVFLPLNISAVCSVWCFVGNEIFLGFPLFCSGHVRKHLKKTWSRTRWRRGTEFFYSLLLIFYTIYGPTGLWVSCQIELLASTYSLSVSVKACNESYEEQLPDFDSWALTAGILLNKVLFFSNKRTRLWL